MDRLDVFVLSSTPIKTLEEILENHEDGVLSGIVPLYDEPKDLGVEDEKDAKAISIKILCFHFLATRQTIKELRIKYANTFLLWHEASKELAIIAPKHVFGPMGSVDTTLDIDDEKKTVSFKGGDSVGYGKSETEEDEKKYKTENGALIERDEKPKIKEASLKNDR